MPYRDQVALAENFSPILYFHEDELYRPRDIRDFLEDATLIDNRTGDAVDEQPVSIDSLEKYYTEDYYLDWDGSSIINHGLKIYAHVFTAYKNKIVIQYWFFYLYNGPIGLGAIDPHEGDWEMIQLILPAKNSLPSDVGYSWHYSIKRSKWTSGDLKRDGNHPIVYVGLGGHASRFTKPMFENYEKEDMSKYSIEILSGQYPQRLWLTFRGSWGATSLFSPQGPVFRHSKPPPIGTYKEAYMWTDPIYWHQDP